MKKNYSEIRQEIKSGDMLAWTNRSWGSLHGILMQLIRFFTRSEYVHVGTAWVVGDRVFVIEAVIPKVRIFPLSALIPFYLIPLPAQWKDETEEFALSRVGEKYSVIQAVLSVIFKPRLDTYWECAELVREIMIKEDIDLGNVYTPSEVINKALSYSSGIRLIES